MKSFFILTLAFVFVGCEGIGLGGNYPAIYTKHVNECGCDGVMYIIENPNLQAQKVTLVRTRQSGTSPKKRKEIIMIIQPKAEKKLGCSEINLDITGRAQYCDTQQSFYVKKYRDLKVKK